ncbi:MAG: hypothetical protein AB8B64_23395 [Granulosicoccus sp.]
MLTELGVGQILAHNIELQFTKLADKTNIFWVEQFLSELGKPEPPDE